MKLLTDEDGNDENKRKPNNTFDFLGFTHYVGKDKSRVKRVKRKTKQEKVQSKLATSQRMDKKEQTYASQRVYEENESQATGLYTILWYNR